MSDPNEAATVEGDPEVVRLLQILNRDHPILDDKPKGWDGR